MEDFKKAEYFVENICELKEKLTKSLCSALDKGIEQIDACELDAITNSIHHLAETETNCFEGLYYKSVVKAMEEGATIPYEELSRIGYVPSKYSTTNGSYNPKIKQMQYVDEYIHDYPNFKEQMLHDMPYNDRMGFTPTNHMAQNGHENYSQHGRPYNEYRVAKRNYEETKSNSDKLEMNEKVMEHVNDFYRTFREMWKDLDPEHKKRFKTDFTAFANELII